MKQRYRSFALRILLSLAACVFSLILAEWALRHRFRDTAYIPGAQILLIQSWLQLHPEIGFAWKPNIDYDDDIMLGWADQEVELAIVSTDSNGFLNHPEAIASLERGDPIDIIGLGDSFMQGAAYPYAEHFAGAGLSYYNLAIQRQAPPQYNLILDRYAVPLKPRLIVYGIFSNDFTETIDFETWQESGLDWFTYHSGTWCGPPVAESVMGYRLRRLFRGFYAAYRGYRAQRSTTTITSPDETFDLEDAVRRVVAYTQHAYTMCRNEDIAFLVLLIPSKRSVLQIDPFEEGAYTQLVQACQASNIPIVNLRSHFTSHPEPARLYNQIDDHWNIAGMLHAAQVIDAFWHEHIVGGPGQ